MTDSLEFNFCNARLTKLLQQVAPLNRFITPNAEAVTYTQAWIVINRVQNYQLLTDESNRLRRHIWGLFFTSQAIYCPKLKTVIKVINILGKITKGFPYFARIIKREERDWANFNVDDEWSVNAPLSLKVRVEVAISGN